MSEEKTQTIQFDKVNNNLKNKIKELSRIKREKNNIEYQEKETIEEIKNILNKDYKGVAKVQQGNTNIIQVIPYDTTRIDTEKFKKEYPDLYKQLIKHTSGTKFIFDGVVV